MVTGVVGSNVVVYRTVILYTISRFAVRHMVEGIDYARLAPERPVKLSLEQFLNDALYALGHYEGEHIIMPATRGLALIYIDIARWLRSASAGQ